MDIHTRHRQKQQNKINRTLQELMTLIMEAQLNKQAHENNENFDAFQEMFTDPLNEPMLTKSVSIAPFLLPTAPANNLIVTEYTTVQTDINICSDLRGINRACCNSATQCFASFKTIIDELDNARSDSFALNSACRQLTYQLKRDQLCVKQSLSRCSGPDKAILDRRFDVRFAYMTDQFYKHCRQEEPVDTTVIISTARTRFEEQTTTQENFASSRTITEGTTMSTSGSVFTTLLHDQNNTGHDGDIVMGHDVVSSATSTAILAGVISGGIVLLFVLAVAIALWCRNKHNKNARDNSNDSLGVFFHKRPNICFRDRVGGANNKLPVCKQDSNIYAEIDENKVNASSDRLPVPGTLPDLSPMSDEKSLLYTPPLTNGPFITSCGQLCYDSVQAANTVSNCAETLFYGSTLVTGNSETYYDQQHISSWSSPPQPQTGHDESVHAIVATSNMDDYEQPVNTSNVSLCCTLTDNEPPPNHFAPAVPNSLNTHNSKKGKCAVKVLPSNSFVPFSLRPVLTSGYRHTPAFNSRQNTTSAGNIWLKNGNTLPDNVNRDREMIRLPSIRDSTSSVNSFAAHHYFVLEPNRQMNYMNSVSAPKMV